MLVHVSFSGSGCPEDREVELSDHAIILDLIGKLGLSGQAYAAAVNGAIVPSDTPLTDETHLVLIRAITGG